MRRFYWLWGVALPLLVGLGAYGFTPDLAENAMQNHVMKLGFAVGAAVVVFLHRGVVLLAPRGEPEQATARAKGEVSTTQPLMTLVK